MLLSSVSCFSQSFRSRPTTRSMFLSDPLSRLRHSGCLFGKLSALLTSHTAAPAVSASSTMLLKPFGRRPAYSASSIGCSALSSLSAIFSIARGSGAIGDGTCTAKSGGSATLSVIGDFLQRGVVAHVDRALRLGHHDRVGARKALRHAVDRGRLVVPLGVVAHRVALHQRGVGPVDVRAALGFVHRAGGAHDEDRHPVEIGVVDRHAGVQQADQVVQDHGGRLAGRLGVAVGDLHRDFLVVAEHHRRLVVAVVDERVVQAAEARAWIERDEREAVALDHVDDDVGLPAGVVLESLRPWECLSPSAETPGRGNCGKSHGLKVMGWAGAVKRRGPRGRTAPLVPAGGDPGLRAVEELDSRFPLARECSG